MVTLKVGRCNDDPRTVHKNFYTTQDFDTYTIEGNMRFPNSVLYPVIIVDISQITGDDTLALTQAKITALNYAQIGSFNRYYFITDIIFISDKLVEFHLKVDVLKSRATEIDSLYEFVNRNENNYDSRLEDRMFPFEYGKSKTFSVPGGGTNLTDFGLNDSQLTTSRRFIAVTCLYSPSWYGDPISTYLNANYPTEFPTVADARAWINKRMSIPAPGSVFPDLTDDLTSITTGAIAPGAQIITYLISYDLLDFLLSRIQDDASLKTYILGITALPLAFESDIGVVGSYLVPLVVNRTNISEGDSTHIMTNPVYAHLVRSGYISKYILHRVFDFTSMTREYTNFEPYSSYEIFLPYFGMQSIPAQEVVGQKLLVYYRIDLITGEGAVFVRRSNEESAFFSAKCQVGYQVPMDATNHREITNARISSGITTAIGVVSSLATLGVGIASANPVAIAGGAVGMGSTLAKAVNTNLTLIDKGSVQYSEVASAYYDKLESYMIITKSIPALSSTSELNSYRKTYGAPLNYYMNLALLSGFTIIENPILNNGTNARSLGTDEEIKELRNLFRTGIIL